MLDLIQSVVPRLVLPAAAVCAAVLLLRPHLDADQPAPDMPVAPAPAPIIHPDPIGQTVSRWVWGLTGIFLVAYDLFAAAYWGQDATLSVVLHLACRRHPMMALGVGIVLGHIFWPLK